MPVRGSVWVSMNPPLPLIAVDLTLPPAGDFSTTEPLEKVTGAIRMLTRWPAVPAKVTLPVVPAVGTFTVTGAPPGTMPAATSPLTLRLTLVAPTVAVTEIVVAPGVVGVKLPRQIPSAAVVSGTAVPPASAVTVSPEGSAQLPATAVIVSGPPTVPTKPATGASTSSSGVAEQPTAAAASSRVPLTVLVASPERASPVPISRARSPAAVASGCSERTSAATPAAWGAAIDVPEATCSPPPGQVEVTSLPGAAMSTESTPLLE